MAVSITLRGADVLVYANSDILEFVTNISYVITTGNREIFGLDQVVPFEIAPGTMTVKGTMSMVREKYTGGLEGKGIFYSFDQLPSSNYFNLVIIDKLTGSELINIDRVSINDQNWNIQTKGIVTGTATFTGIIAKSNENF